MCPVSSNEPKKRAKASGLKADFVHGDVQDLPFPDDHFDVILSVYGVQFAPDQKKAASEMLRVCRSGRKIGLAGPVPEGWSGDFFAAHAQYVSQPDGVDSPLRWGANKGLNELFGDKAGSMKSVKSSALQYYLSVDHAVEVFSTWFGPTIRALEKTFDDQQRDFLNDLRQVFARYNRSEDETAVIENTYLQSMIYL